MVNQAEDLIRETFQKLGDTLGIHIDIPDEVIANLAATLQADIDRLEAVDTERFSFLNELGVAFRRGEKNARPSQLPVLEGIRAVLAHLTTAGRLIPAGGMALTAEQVEDVRKVLGKATTEYGAMELTAAWTRLRALFPATEPVEKRRFKADEETRKALGFHYPFEGAWSKPDPAEPAEKVKPVKFRKMTAKYATANFGFPDVTDPFTRWAYKDSDGHKWAWNGDQWELHSAPTEPAEEATKAERRDPDELAKRMALIWEGGWDEFDEKERDYLRCAAEIARAYYASSPVVSAPTETEWQSLNAVPAEVAKVRDSEGFSWRRVGRRSWEGQTTQGRWAKVNNPANFDYCAPFVAAEEG